MLDSNVVSSTTYSSTCTSRSGSSLLGRTSTPFLLVDEPVGCQLCEPPPRTKPVAPMSQLAKPNW